MFIMARYGLKIMQSPVKVKELHFTLLYQSSISARSDNQKILTKCAER